jgi:hypothetical protein
MKRSDGRILSLRHHSKFSNFASCFCGLPLIARRDMTIGHAITIKNHGKEETKKFQQAQGGR